MDQQPLFLTLLPPELRLKIYTYLLTFSRPLKVRQWTSGTSNTSILRTNRLVYTETLPVLYDCNTILVSRNDLCQETSAELQTPIAWHRLRHLLVKNISKSIRCSQLPDGFTVVEKSGREARCCTVCESSGRGLVKTIVARAPDVKTVRIDYQHSPSAFRKIKWQAEGSRGCGIQLECVDVAKYRLMAREMIPERVEVTFVNGAFNHIWNELLTWPKEEGLNVYGLHVKDNELALLRKDIDPDLPDKLYFLHCARRSLLWPSRFQRMAELWAEVDAAKREGRDASDVTSALTDDVENFCETRSSSRAKTELMLLRIEHTRLQNEGAVRMLDS